jgi:hypothetical protein
MKSAALLVGINYVNDGASRLRGCLNDVCNIQKYLSNNNIIAKKDIVILTDDRSEFVGQEIKGEPTGHAIVKELTDLAMRSIYDDLDLAWFHYSGHGSQLQCDYADINGNCDELDGKDECLVPSDYRYRGVVRDDVLKNILRKFNPKTRVICILDCCHSGTGTDLKYRFKNRNDYFVENQSAPCAAKVITISGCRDTQTSADAYNVNGMRKFTGAMTSCLLQCLNLNPTQNVFDLVENMTHLLMRKGFTQRPQLTASHDIRIDSKFL